jgi:hypothetical protein
MKSKGSYVTPTVTDYGTLVDLTAATEPHGHEDGCGKAHGNPHVSSPC